MAAIAADEECSSDSEADVSDDGVAEDGVGNAISPKPIGGKEKKRKSRVAGGGTIAKKATMENRNLKVASGADGLIQSIFVEGVCIPMWPQYVDGRNTFIRIGTQEAWVNQFMVALRKAVVPREKQPGCIEEERNGRGISSNAYVTK